MINTDKYEGHTPAEHWNFSTWGITIPTGFEADAQLIADAPLLLEEVKRLQAMNNILSDMAGKQLGRIKLPTELDNEELLAEVKRLREDYERMSEVLRQHGMDICRHCRVIYRDDEMNHPHYPSLHPWHMDGMCMKEAKKND